MVKTIYKVMGSTILATILLTGCGGDTNNEVQSDPTVRDNGISSSYTVGTNSSKDLEVNNLTDTESYALSAFLEATAAANNTNQLNVASRAPAAVQTVKSPNSVTGFKVQLNQYKNLSGTTKATTVVKLALSKMVKNGVITEAEKTAFENSNNLNQVYIDTFVAEYMEVKHNGSTNSAKQSPRRSILSGITDKIGDTLKSGILEVVNVDAVTDLTAEAFKLVLKSDGMTVVMIDMAIGSETISQIMVDVMKENWDLTLPMIPMMTDTTNTEFTEKFTYLAGLHNNLIGDFLFTYIDKPMYDALTKAMVIPTTTGSSATRMENTNLDITYQGNMVVASNVGKLMTDIGVRFFIKPDTTLTPEARGPSSYSDVYAGKDAFARLMVDGVNNGIVNERLFYSLFSESKTTGDFVKTMQNVKSADANTATYFMDSIFLGGELDNLANLSTAEKDQAMKNIYAIAKAMIDGTTKEGLGAYSGSFIGFAGLIPFDRYKPYAMAFGSAGYYYIKSHGLEIPGGSIGGWISDKFFADEATVANQETASVQKASARRAAAIDGTTDNTVSEKTILTTTLEWFDNLFNSYANWLSEATAFLTDSETGKTVAVAFDEMLGSIKTGIDTAIADIIAKGHDAVEAKIQVVINDVNYTLPPFEDINLDYITTTAKTTAIAIMEDPATVRKFSENDIVKGVYDYVNESLTTNTYLGYIPTWMTKLDWIELPANVETMPAMKMDFASGSVDIFILSDNADVIDLQTQVLGNQVLLSEVSIEDSPIVVDKTSGNYENLHVYKFTIHASDLIDIDKIIASIGTLIGENVNGVAIDSSNAIVETPSVPAQQ